MHFESHFTLGWTIGNAAGADRRLRNYCVIGAIIPDIDAIGIIGGLDWYNKLHHTFGHNIFFALLFAGFVTYRLRTARAFVFSLLSIGAHLLTDAYFTRWELYLFWPIRDMGYLIAGGYRLGHPINYYLVYFSFPFILFLAFWLKRTPVDIFSPKLDHMIIASFQPKKMSCSICSGKSNLLCDSCQKPVCMKHGALKQGIVLQCSNCRN